MSDSGSRNDGVISGGGFGISSGQAYSQTLQRVAATYRHENALIKTELSACLDRHKKELQEVKLRCQAEVSEAQRCSSEAEARVTELQSRFLDDQRKLNQNNVELKQKAKMLEEDLEEARMHIQDFKVENAKLEEDVRQKMLESSVNLEVLKAERVHLAENLETLQSELEKERTTVRELTTTLASERHQSNLIKSRIGEIEQQSKIQVATANAEIEQLKSLQQQQSALAEKHISDLKEALEEEKRSLQQLREAADEHEQDLIQHHGQERQMHLSQSHQLMLENAKLQQKIKSLEGELASVDTKHCHKVELLEKEKEDCLKKLQESETDRALLQNKVCAMERLEIEVRSKRDEVSLLYQEVNKLKGEKEELIGATTVLKNNIQQFKSRLQESQEEFTDLTKVRDREKSQLDKFVLELRSQHQEELAEYRGRVSMLETKLMEKSRHYLEETDNLRQKTRTYTQLIRKLRHKLDVGSLRQEQLEAQKKVLEDNVPIQRHRELQTQLYELTRKHSEFAAYIKGLSEFQSHFPKINELTDKFGILGQKLAELEESQLQCFSELESL